MKDAPIRVCFCFERNIIGKEGRKGDRSFSAEATVTNARDSMSDSYEYFKDKIRHPLPHFWVCLSFYYHFTFGINWPPRLSKAPGFFPENSIAGSLEAYRVHNHIAYKNCLNRAFVTFC